MLKMSSPFTFCMRYYYDPPKIHMSLYGKTYKCDHPVYSRCTLYLIDGIGLAVIQQRYNKKDKSTYWTEIDSCLVDALYLNDGFMEYFNRKAGKRDKNKCYPTVTVRQLMWGLRVKPLPREPWETVFDKSPI